MAATTPYDPTQFIRQRAMQQVATPGPINGDPNPTAAPGPLRGRPNPAPGPVYGDPLTGPQVGPVNPGPLPAPSVGPVRGNAPTTPSPDYAPPTVAPKPPNTSTPAVPPSPAYQTNSPEHEPVSGPANPPNPTQPGPAPTPAPGPQTSDYSGPGSQYTDIIQAYRQFLGRDPSYDEILSQTGNGTFAPNDPRIAYSVNNIRLSPEARAYAERRNSGTGDTGSGSGVPSYVNLNDPIQKAVWAAYAAKHMTPRDQGDFQYWVDRINQTGGNTTDNMGYWTARMAQGSGGVGDYSGAPEAGSGGGGNTTMPGATSAYTDQIRQMLLARLNADSQPVDENSAQISVPFAAANVSAQRQLEQARKANAEAAYAEAARGGGAANPESLMQKTQQMNEQVAGSLANVKATLIANELQARRADLNSAMQQALVSGDAETAHAIQMAIAQLDAELQREGIGATLAMYSQNQNNNGVGSLI